MTSPTAPPPMRVDRLLGELLEATATKTAASRRIDRLRDVLDTEARRRYAAEGAAPTWKAPKLGSVRLDPKDARAYVADADAFASYVAQRFPSEVAARLELDAAQLEAALEALSFAGVTVHRSAVEVRPAFIASLLEGAEVLYDDTDPANIVKVVARQNTTTGELERVDGADVLAPSATLVVTLDRTRKAAELARVDEQLEGELKALGVEPTAPPTDEQEAEAKAIGDRLRASVAMTGQPVDEAVLDQAVDVLTDPDPEAALAAALRPSSSQEPGTEAEQDVAELERRELADLADADYGEAVAASVELTAATDHPTEPEPLASLAGIPVTVDPALDPDTAVLRREGMPDVVITGSGNPGPPPGQPTGRAGRVFAPQPGDPGYSLSPTPSRVEGGAELLPGSTAAPEASSLEPLDEAAIAAQALATLPPIAAGEDQHDPPRSAATATAPVTAEPPTDDPVTELATKYGTDTLKRLARTKRVPVSGTKVLLAGRLHKAGVTPADAAALEAELAGST